MTKKNATQLSHRLLVADDNDLDRMLAVEALRRANFEVFESDDGSSTLAAFRKHRPDLVLLDLIMPEPDGFEVCSKLRATEEGAYTPIVVMTSLNDSESIDKAYEFGATDFIIKPIVPALLVYRLRYALRATQTASALRDSQSRLSAAQRKAKLGYWEWNPATDVVEWSAEISTLFGFDPGLSGSDYRTFLSFVAKQDRERVQQTIRQARKLNQGYRIDHKIRSRDGEERFAHQEAEWNDGLLSGILQDISELRQAEQRIHQLAYYDNVTGLPNRAHLQENLRETLARARRYKHSVAVLFLDLDKFKEVNDRFGHGAGDSLLKQLAGRLLDCVRSHDAVIRANEPVSDGNGSDTVVRLGGDEFVIVAGDIHQHEDAVALCERIVQALQPPFLVGEETTTITTSIGICLYPKDGEDLDVLLNRADAAMYQAKQSGRNNFQFFDGSADKAG